MMGITLARKLCKYLRKEVNKFTKMVESSMTSNQVFAKYICDIEVHMQKIFAQKQIYDTGETVN